MSRRKAVFGAPKDLKATGHVANALGLALTLADPAADERSRRAWDARVQLRVGRGVRRRKTISLPPLPGSGPQVPADPQPAVAHDRDDHDHQIGQQHSEENARRDPQQAGLGHDAAVLLLKLPGP